MRFVFSPLFYMQERASSRAIEIWKWMAQATTIYDSYPRYVSRLEFFIKHLPRVSRPTKIETFVDTKIIHEFERRFGMRTHRGLWNIEWAFVKWISYRYFFLLLHDRLWEHFTIIPHILWDDIDKNAYYFPKDLIYSAEQFDIIQPNHILKAYEKDTKNSPSRKKGSQRMVQAKQGEI